MRKNKLLFIAVTIALILLAVSLVYTFIPRKKATYTISDAKTVEDIGQVGPGDSNKQPANPNQFTFAILGDTQMFYLKGAEGDFAKAVDSIEKKNPDLVMTVGDLIQSCDNQSECAAYKLWKEIMKPMLPKTYEVMGNHDAGGENFSDKVWQEEFNLPDNGPAGYKNLVYSFDYGNSHFVVLNSERPELHKIDETQQKWLENDLSNNHKENTLVFFHEPAFPISQHVGESLDHYPEYRDPLWEILDKHNVTAVFNGHETIDGRRKIDSAIFPQAKNQIYQFIFGETDEFGRKDEPIAKDVEFSSKDNAYAMVKVSGRQITVDVYSLPDDKLINSFTFSK